MEGDPNRSVVQPVRKTSSRRELLQLVPVGGIAAEIGVHLGKFAMEVLALTTPRILHLVDPWPAGVRIFNGCDVVHGDEAFALVQTLFSSQITTGKVVLHRCRLEDFCDLSNACDWVYLDADHSYGATLVQLAASANLLKPGGWLCGHDLNLSEVARAVWDFCQNSPWRMHAISVDDGGGHFSFALRKSFVK